MAEVYTREGFVRKYNPYINDVVKGTGILSGTLIAQAIVESSGKVDGKWLVGGSTLSREANNFFGIKADSRWKGDYHVKKTREVDKNGNSYYIESKFRKYPTVKDSIADYVKFLQQNERYRKAGVFEAKNVLEQATALKKAGYATATNYPDTVNAVFNSVKGFMSNLLLPIPDLDLGKKKNKKIIPMMLITVGVISLVYLVFINKETRLIK
jgi:flagellum-specific peptidoglycan hydrolase FlgJ